MSNEEQGMRLDVADAGPEFFADEVAISHSPVKFVIDFKSITPRLDMQGQQPRHVLKHNIIKIDTFLAKDLIDVLKKNVEKYEKQYGKIEKPKQLERGKKERKKAKKQDYFG